MLISVIFFMDPAPSGKTLPTLHWEEFIGTAIAILTLTLPVAAIATYVPATPPHAQHVVHKPAETMN
jgi:hypothetical protein